MSPPLDEQYLTWLYSLVDSVRITDPSKTHWALCRKLFTTEFIWFVPNDDNRAEDGRALRDEFVAMRHVSPDDDWMRLGCSMLEMMIALARHAAFESGWTRRTWFWEMVDNLGLENCADDRDPFPEEMVEEALHAVIWRTYKEDGTGGLFPVPLARDMPKVELWYQLQRYMIENHAY